MKIEHPGLAGLADPALRAAVENKAEEGKSFGEVLKGSLAEVDRLQKEADAAIESLASGEGGSVHETMIAMEQADVSFKLMMQVRNKIVEAYQEILRMQV